MTELADSPMLAYLLAVLESIMTPALADPALARKAAQQALDAYQPRTMMELIVSGQILSFALGSMETLRLAAAETVSTSMKLKLQGNANGLNRAARHHTQNLHNIRQSAPHPGWQTPKPSPEMPTPPKLPEAKPTPGPNTSNWATAMTSVAAKLRAQTSPTEAQRQFNALWIGALTTVAAEAAPTLRCDRVAPPLRCDRVAPPLRCDRVAPTLRCDRVAPTLRCDSVAPPRQPRVVPLKPRSGSPRP